MRCNAKNVATPPFIATLIAIFIPGGNLRTEHFIEHLPLRGRLEHRGLTHARGPQLQHQIRLVAYVEFVHVVQVEPGCGVVIPGSGSICTASQLQLPLTGLYSSCAVDVHVPLMK